MTVRTQRRNGLTLVEVMISSLLVGTVLVAAMKTVGSTLVTRRIAVDVHVGPALASDLMSVVLQAAYADPEDPAGPIGRDSGEASSPRDEFDDVDDFDGWSSSSPVKSDGSSLGYGAGWQRNVSVSYVAPDTLTSSGSDTGLKLITVTVTPATGSPTVFQALRSSLGAVERLPSLDSIYVTSSQMELQTTGVATDIVSGTAIKNHGRAQ